MSHPRSQSRINICVYCKKQFSPFVKEAKYCSNECKGKSKQRGKIINCFYCNKKIYKKKKLFGRVNSFYCSKECKDLDSRYTNASNELKKQAHYLVREKIKKGEILRLPCEICEKKGFAHHYKGYEKKNWFTLQWLCASHHSLEHQSHVRRKHI